MEVNELKDLIIESLKDAKTDKITVINVKEQTSLADYMVIISLSNHKATKSTSLMLEEKMEKHNIKATRIDGYDEGRWIVVDYSDIIVHIFNQETLGFYQLEKLWSTDENVEIINI